MPRTGQIVALFALLVLAGCSGTFLGGQQAHPSTSETASATPTTSATEATTTTTEVTAADFPPGMTEHGVVDVGDFTAAHVGVLADVSYTRRRVVTERYENGTIRAKTSRVSRVAAEDGRYLITHTVDGTIADLFGEPNVHVEQWSNGSVVLTAYTDRNQTVYRRSPAIGGDSNYDDLYLQFSTVNTTVTERTTENGTRVYRIESTGVSHPDALAIGEQVDRVRNVSLSALVTADGLVKERRFAYTATRGNASVRVRSTVRYSDVGLTTVERPEWVTTALHETNATSAK